MEETSSVIVSSVNIGNLIITRREVLEACIIEAVLVSGGFAGLFPFEFLFKISKKKKIIKTKN